MPPRPGRWTGRARVAVVARSPDGLAEVAAGLGREPVVIPADLREPGAAAEAAASALGALSSVDILVNTAAAAARLATADTDAAVIDEMLAVNVRARTPPPSGIGQCARGIDSRKPLCLSPGCRVGGVPVGSPLAGLAE